MQKISGKRSCWLIFIVITLVYILTRWLIFKGFNGTDDLHYSMLAARMIKGEYDPFQPHDIFSGRILVVASQAAVFKIFGINTVSTVLGSLIIALISCYLIVFKLLPVKDAINTLTASSLFYFCPVLTYLTNGVQGDSYIMLTGIFILMILKSWILNEKVQKKSISTGCLLAFIIALTLLYKESVLVFLPFVCLIPFFYDSKNAKLLVLSVLATFTGMLLIYACFYYYFTEDALFKVAQMKNSNYLNYCSYDRLLIKYLIIRLTYGPWQEFIVKGFYPLVFGAFIAAMTLLKRRPFVRTNNIFCVFFAILMMVSLYFPFSLNGYQPLCSDPRQFLLMLPAGVLVCTNFICNEMEGKNAKIKFIFCSLFILIICVLSTRNKWQWMIYSLISITSIVFFILGNLLQILKYFALSAILWLSVMEHLFFQNSNWFKDMTLIEKRLSSRYYYFPDHDNMMHWQLLHQFDDKAFTFYNLEKNPFKIFKIYYQQIDPRSFNPGWLIINKKYTVRSPGFLQKIDSLKKTNYFPKEMAAGDVDAFLIDNQERLAYVQSIIQMDE